MCLVLVAYKIDASYPLIVAANRDEYFSRPALPAHFWQDAPEIFAGRDDQAGGTWLGITPQGRFAAITNWTASEDGTDGYLSRGWLVRDFLVGESSAREFVELINGDSYRGFNLLVFDGRDLVYCSNRTNQSKVFTPGFYGVTNTSFANQWNKTRVGLDMISQVRDRHDVDTLIHLLRRHSTTSNRYKSSNAFPENRESPCFVFGETYGTRASTAVVFDHKRIFFKEQQYGPRAVRGSFVYECINRE